LNSWLSNFGAKKIKLKPFMKIVETNANSSNPQIRSEAMNFYKECYKWLKEGLKPLIADLKKQQLVMITLFNLIFNRMIWIKHSKR
jgi:hypothetical protein